MYRFFVKRLLDIILASLLIIVTLPLLFFIIPILAVYYRGNPLFSQNRPGLNGRIFRLYKLKSMIEKFDSNGKILPDAERLTKLGIIIRKTSLDELPQLYNVLLGDMSFIGPRPLLVDYLPYYTKREQLRHSVRPGITGLAQVSGRNSITLPERLELDVIYIEHLSFINDFLIVIKTIKNVLSSKDVSVLTRAKTLKDYREEESLSL